MFRGRLGRKTNKNYQDIQYSCTIRFLDDSDPLSLTYQKDTKGQYLIDQACKALNLLEKEYYGLRYVDFDKQRHWLEPLKPVYKQLKNVNPPVLCFRVKFYPTDPSKLKEELTRYFLFLQLRRDLHHGRLLCSPADANLLAAYIIQSELGDYDKDDHCPGYVSQFKMLPKQTQKQEEKIVEIHKAQASDTPADAEAKFLQKSSTLDTYGVDPHPVKDQRGNQMYLGVTHLGIVTFQGNKRTHLFKWNQVTKIAFEGKMFIVHITISEMEAIKSQSTKGVYRESSLRDFLTGRRKGEENALLMKGKKHACGFKCPSYSACKHLWKCAVEQQYFFTLQTSAEVPKVTSGGGIFTRGSKFRFSGRCQKEVYVDSASITRDEPHFSRSSSNPSFVRSFKSSRSASMPLQLKDTTLDSNDLSDVALDTNHVSRSSSQLDSSNSLIRHGLDDSFPDYIDDTILEEEAVEVGETSYRPMQSPSRESLPALPLDDDHPDSSTQEDVQDTSSSPTEQNYPTKESNHVGQSPVDLSHPVTSEPSMTSQGNSCPLASIPAVVGESAPTEDDELSVNASENSIPAVQQGGLRFCRVLTVTFFIVFSAMLVMVFFVLESELDVPVLKDIRQMPEVQDFKSQHYNPFKTTVVQRMGGWFKA